MFCRVPFLAILTAVFWGQVARADDTNTLRRFEQQLVAVLRWEILWNDSPMGFQIPSNGSARFALYAMSNSLSYCSHDVGVCARYRIESHRNWERIASNKCDGSQSDEDALLEFVGEGVRKPYARVGSQSKPALGPGGFAGSPVPGSGITWTTAIGLSSRAEIRQQYKQSRPPEIDGLQRWLRATIPPSAGYRSITIACFAPWDPLVYLYGDRPAKGPIVFAVFWDREREEWVQAGMLERPEDRKKLEEMHSVIESITCSTVKFE